mmetsp:Transcript_20667/g.58431  ORF Transcript_20667/g.58431 Transcript_20667/m.58431 type:complete len:298 (-) Transcript_20667:22-915(-)
MPSGHTFLNVVPATAGAAALCHGLYALVSQGWHSPAQLAHVVEIWLGTGFVTAGAALLFDAPRLYCKRASGEIPPFVWVYLGGWLLVYRGSWLAKRALADRGLQLKANDRLCDLVAERVLLGRLTWSLPSVDGAPEVDMVVDLTCEWSAPEALRSVPEYVAVPVVDTTRPRIDQLLHLSELVCEHLRRPEAGSVYIHCANGYGRSAVAAAVVLLANGTCATPLETVRVIKAARPVVSLNKSRRRWPCEAKTHIEVLQEVFREMGGADDDDGEDPTEPFFRFAGFSCPSADCRVAALK